MKETNNIQFCYRLAEKIIKEYKNKYKIQTIDAMYIRMLADDLYNSVPQEKINENLKKLFRSLVFIHAEVVAENTILESENLIPIYTP